MRFSTAILSAFLPAICVGFTVAPAPTRRCFSISPLRAEAEEQTESAASIQDEVEPDSHDELIYALGVNLARQLGDVRPLVENGDELALVAKGLLDTVVGRLPEQNQQLLLAKRGKELNKLITERANRIKEKLEQAGRDVSRVLCGF